MSPRFADLARATQQRTGIPTILLDGALAKIPDTFRKLGAILHREGRAEVLARFAEALLALPVTRRASEASLYARGADGLTVAAPDTDVTEVFTRLGWQVVAPDGQGSFRRPASTRSERSIRTCWSSPIRPCAKRSAQSEAWQTVRAVREGHVLVSPSLPFGWVEEPPSINRLAGLAWLSGRDPVTLAAVFNAVVYGHALTSAQLDAVLAGVRPRSTLRGPSMRFLLFLCVLLVPLAARAQELTVFAAASLTDAMKDVSALWVQAGHPPLRMSFGSSSTLARQIEQGAPANVFASADEKWMDYLAQKNLIVADTRKDLLGNDLVLVVPGRQAAARHHRPRLRPVGSARPDRPAGGRRSGACAGWHLCRTGAEEAGMWDSVAPRLARADDVRAALLLVERGEAPAGIVYGTDAAVSKGVMVAGTFPASSHDPVTYPFAVGQSGRHARSPGFADVPGRPAGARGVRAARLQGRIVPDASSAGFRLTRINTRAKIPAIVKGSGEGSSVWPPNRGVVHGS